MILIERPMASLQVHTMPAGGKPRLLAKQPQQPTLTDLQYLVQVRFASAQAQNTLGSA